jgi:hypothetical protein
MKKEQEQNRIEGQYRTFEDFRDRFYSHEQLEKESTELFVSFGKHLAKTIFEQASTVKQQG